VDSRISHLAGELHHRPEALIELLHRLQALDGFLSKASLGQVAEVLGLPLSRVYGVASFYHLFRLEPPQPHRCAVCMGSACFVLGACRLAAHLEQRLGLRLEPPSGSANGAPVRPGAARASHRPAGSGAGGPSPVGPSAAAWSLEPVSCLGACGQAPVLVVDGVLALRLPVDSPGALGSRLDRLGVPRASGLGGAG
jgi:NADH:ubiquinone oxidoreductase subunit E